LQAFELSIARGTGKGRTFRLPEDRAFTIGRGHSNDLTLADRLVSSHHARVEALGGYFVLADLNSKNHTYVNGVAVVGSVILRDRDQVGIGDTVLVVRAASGSNVTLADGPDSRPVVASIETARTMAVDAATIKTAITNLGRAEKNLAVLHATGKLLLDHHEPADFLPRLLDMMFEVVPADRGAVFLLEKGDLRSLHARDASGQALPTLSISRSVIRRTVEEGVSVLTGNALGDARFKGNDSIVLHQIASAMCAPIRGRNEVLGAIYLDSKISGKAFEDADLELLTTVATQAGMANENSRLARDTAERERMAAIGLLVAGLAHDIKNYMLGVNLGQEIVEGELREKCSADCVEAWSAMKDAQARVGDLVQDMLAFSKPRDPDWALEDPNAVVSRAAKVLERRAAESGVLLEVKRHPRSARAWFDPRGIERCLVNLAANGIDATPGGGTVTLKVVAPKDGDAVEFHVSDTGAGIPPESRSRVFDLFYSTKRNKGTGIGLAVSKKAVEEHGGTLTFTTEVNEGTTFVLRLPRHAEPPPPRA
jgi:two-component system NtrC family sensor kinase